MESTLSSRSQRMFWVDSLRGIASLMVAFLHLWHHVIQRYKIPMDGSFAKVSSSIIEGIFDLGKIGVVTFFIISGYLVSFSLKNKDLRIFAISRFFRLYPAYWLSIALAVVLLGAPPLLNLLMNITMFHKFVGIPDFVGVYWTLQVELTFYILCSILVYFNYFQNNKILYKIPLGFLAMALVLAALRYYLDKKFPVGLCLGLSVMFLGLLIKKYLVDRDIPKHIVRNCVIIFFVTLLPICLLAYNKDYGFNERWYVYYSTYAVSFVLFFLFLNFKFAGKFLLFLGTISYSLYLLHTILGFALTEKVLSLTGISQFDSPIAYIILYWSFSIGGAYLCYTYIEKRFIAYGKKITDQMKHKKLVTVAS